MESDLPLLEISGDDDTLLLPQQIHTANDADVSSNCFTCSPLQFQGPTHRPPPSALGVAEENPKKLTSFSKDKSNKENDEANTSEPPKLGIDPQQMKRKKKGGSYNMRKSLAWNNAFFTEEGVLDPFELSLISGTSIDSSGESLSAIKEEGCSMPVLQSKSLKRLPSPVASKSKRVGSATMSKCDSPGRANLAPRPVATRKVLSSHDINRSGLMSNISRPAPSSSQKRPANANITRVPMRESKLPKYPAAKPDSSVLPKVTKGSSLVAARPKIDQIVHRENVPKTSGIKGSVRSYRSDRSTAKAAASDKSQASIRSSKKVTVNSLARVPPSSTSKPMVGRVDNDVPKMIPDPILPTKGSTFDDSEKLAFAGPPNIKCTTGDIPKSQPQSTKPTFLRMPSPSIGYFGQPNVSAPQSLLSRTSQACNTIESTSDSQKFHVIDPISAQKPPLAPKRKQKFTLDFATAEKSRCSSMSSERHVLTEAETSLSSMSCEGHVLNGADTSLSSISCEGHVLNEADTSLSSIANTDVEGHSSKNNGRVLSQERSISIPESVGELSQGRPDPYNMEEVSCNIDVKLHVKPSNQLKGVSDQKNVADLCLEVQNPSLEKVTDCHIPNPSGLQVNEDNELNVYIEDQSITSVLECEESSRYFVPEICLNLSRNSLGTEDETYSHDADKLPSEEDHVLFLGIRSCEDAGEYEMEHCNMASQSLYDHSQPKDMKKPNDVAVQEDITVTNINLVDACIHSSISDVRIQSRDSKTGDSAFRILAAMNEGATEHLREIHTGKISHGLQSPMAGVGIGDEVGQCNDVSGRNDLDSSLDSSKHISNQETEGVSRVHNMTQELQTGPEIRLSDSNLLVESSNLADTSVILSYVTEDITGRLLSQKPCSFLEVSENTCGVTGTESNGISTCEAPLELDTTQSVDASVRSMDIGLVDYQNADGDTKSTHEIELIGLATSKCAINSNVCEDQAMKSITHGCLASSCDESERSAQIHQISDRSEEDGRVAHSRSDIFLLEPDTKSSDNESSENQNLQRSSAGCFASNISLHPDVALVSFVVPSTGGSSHENLYGPSPYMFGEQDNEGTSMELTKMDNLHTGGTEEWPLEQKLNAVSCYDWSDGFEEHEISPMMANISGEESGSVDQNDQSSANQSSPRWSSVGELQCKDVPEVAETRNSHITTDGNLLQKLDNPLSPSGEDSMPIKRSGKDLKKDILTIKPPLNVVPFSDEWLAAMEAAGEDILTLKSGAVQHSPVDKAIPEPSPWSPVRKKNNQAIGPFDCTKYTNAQL